MLRSSAYSSCWGDSSENVGVSVQANVADVEAGESAPFSRSILRTLCVRYNDKESRPLRRTGADGVYGGRVSSELIALFLRSVPILIHCEPWRNMDRVCNIPKRPKSSLLLRGVLESKTPGNRPEGKLVIAASFLCETEEREEQEARSRVDPATQLDRYIEGPTSHPDESRNLLNE